MRTALALILTVLLSSISAVISAQTPGTSVHGVVVDPSGGVLVGATVTYHAGSVERTVTTDAEGRFAIPGVPAGGTLTVAFPSFHAATDTVASDGAMRVVLTPDAVQESVTVNGRAVRSVVSATKTDTLLRDVPQAISVVSQELIADQRMQGMADVVRYMPGVGMAQGEGNRDTPILRGNSTTSDFFVDGVRDDVQYFRDVYNVERVEALKGPNAMIFGRGGVGGVINRVSRQADWQASREVGLQFGSWGDRRFTTDLGGALNDATAGRMTAMFQSSDSFRDDVTLERYGVNPTAAFQLGPRTLLRASYEYFHDDRTADRGISSYHGKPVDTPRSTFFGDPLQSNSMADVHVASAFIEHRLSRGGVLRNRTSYGVYDKFYQNVFPGAVNAAGTTVSISAYNNATDRTNLFNQTDLILTARTGPIAHNLLTGAELGRQGTDNFRMTGYFATVGPNVTSVNRPLDDPRTNLPLEFRQGATDADNDGVATVAALYAQDQVTLSQHVQAIAGVRVDRFHVDFTNNRTAVNLSNTDILVSPRAGLVVKPIVPLSIYGNFTVSYLPRAGEQLASLSLTNQALDPEKFTNYEAGVKWDLARSLALTAALYRLDRSNVAIPDPTDPTRSILANAQRTNGVEIELSGSVVEAWRVAGGYAYQDGTLTETISATAQAGATLAMLPTHSFSLWNRVDLSRQWGVGLGIVYRGDSYTSVDNTVVLPAYTRADAGIFYTWNQHLRAQVNVENLFDTCVLRIGAQQHEHLARRTAVGSPVGDDDLLRPVGGRLLGQRVRSQLEVRCERLAAFAALDQPRRTIAVRGPQAAPLPPGVRIVDAAVEPLREEPHRVGHAQYHHLPVRVRDQPVVQVAGRHRHIVAQPECVVLVDPRVIARLGAVVADTLEAGSGYL